MRGKDKGFSLVELIVVIAIMAVATTVSGYALSTISLANAKNCATEIKSKLEAVRMDATRNVEGDVQVVELYSDDGSVYLKVGTMEPKRIGNSNVKVVCDGKELSTIEEPVEFSFDKSSGAFDEIGCKTIVVSGASREYTLTLYAKTGKVKME